MGKRCRLSRHGSAPMKKESLVRSTSLLSLATLTSRVFGLVRDSSIAAFVPVAWQDIFWAGIKIPSTFRQLFAEGALSAAFIPMLTRVHALEGEEKARDVGDAIFLWLTVTVAAVVAAAIVTAPWFVPILLNFPEGERWKIPEGVRVTQMMFPFLFFIALSAWAMGVLNTHRYFFIPALAPVFYNITLITGCVLSAYWFTGRTLMAFLSAVVVAGGMMQFLVQVPTLCRLRYFPPRRVGLGHPRIREFLRKLAPSVFGLAIYQINALVTQTYFASKYGEGGISILTYAHRLIEFPLGVVGVALATASFPRVAQLFSQNDEEAAARTIMQVTRYLMLLMIPALVGLIVMGHDIVGVIYNRGEFRRNDWLDFTVQATAGYALGLLSYAMAKVLVQSFQAQHDFRTPVQVGAVSVGMNLALCAGLSSRTDLFPLWTMAISSALASPLNALLLLILLKRRVQSLRLAFLAGYGLKVLLAAGVMGLACGLFVWGFPLQSESLSVAALRVLLGIGVGMLVDGACGRVLFWDDLRTILRLK